MGLTELKPRLILDSANDRAAEFNFSPEVQRYAQDYCERASRDNTFLWDGERTQMLKEEIHTYPGEWLANTLLLGKIVFGLKRKGKYTPPGWLATEIKKSRKVLRPEGAVTIRKFTDTLYKSISFLPENEQVDIARSLYLGLVFDFRGPIGSLQAETHKRAKDTEFGSFKDFRSAISALGEAALNLQRTKETETKADRAAYKFMDVSALEVYNNSALAVSVGFRDLNELHEVLFGRNVKGIRELAGKIRPFGKKYILPLLQQIYSRYRNMPEGDPDFSQLSYFQKLALTTADRLEPDQYFNHPFLLSEEAKSPLREIVRQLVQKTGILDNSQVEDLMAGVEIEMGEKPEIFPQIIDGKLRLKIKTVPNLNGMWVLLEEIGHAIDYYFIFRKTGGIDFYTGMPEVTAGKIQRQLTGQLAEVIKKHLPQFGDLPEDYFEQHARLFKRKTAFFLVHKACQVEIEALFYERLGDIVRRNQSKIIRLKEISENMKLLRSVSRIGSRINRSVNQPVFALGSRESVYTRAVQFISMHYPDWLSAEYLMARIQELLPDGDLNEAGLIFKLEQALIRLTGSSPEG